MDDRPPRAPDDRSGDFGPGDSGSGDSGPGDSEFVFELLTCRWAERAWHPESGGAGASASTADGQGATLGRTDENGASGGRSDETGTDGGPTAGAGGERSAIVVGRQLGTRWRRWDTVVVECDPAGLAARRRLDDRELDSDLLHVVRDAPAEWAWYRDALPDPGYPWRYVREAVHRAAARDLVEKRRAGNRIEIRRVAPYPDWVRRIVAVENKPDLDASAARALRDQLEHDVETALADEVWVATAATGADVEPALLEDVPVEVGIVALDFSEGARADAGEVLWYPGALEPGEGEDGSGGRSESEGGGGFDADERAERRLVLAERAYGRGWRSYRDTVRPDCRHFELRRAGNALLPYCAAKGKHQTAAECAGSCPDFSPEPPGWRTKGWPIEGGPGKGIRRLLRARRERVRDRQTDGG